MSILTKLKEFFVGKPTAPTVVEEVPPTLVPEVVQAVVTEEAPAKKPRAPRKPKVDNWLQPDATPKGPAKIKAVSSTKKAK